MPYVDTHALLFSPMPVVASNSRFPLLCFITFLSFCWLHSLLRRPGGNSDSAECKRLLDDVEGGLRELDDVKESLREQDDVKKGLREPNDIEGGLCEDKANGTTPKRRALLVGISYENSSSEWELLEGAHIDVACFRDLLISAYSSQHLAGRDFPYIGPYPRNLRILPERHHHP